MKFSFEETRDIIAQSPVHCSMRTVLDNKLVRPEPGCFWTYRGQQHPVSPFRLFRNVVEHAVIMAYTASVGKERERLLMSLRMVGADAIEPVAKAVADACEEYAVAMQHGADGWRCYQESFKLSQPSYTQK